MFAQIIVSFLIYLSFSNLSSKLNGENFSLAYNTYTSVLLTLFQIFLSVSLLGLFPGGLALKYLITLNVLISGVLLFYARDNLKRLFVQYRLRFQSQIFAESGVSSYLVIFLLGVFIFEILFLSIKAYFFPNYVWDEMVYHLHPVVVWYQTLSIPMSIDTPSPWVNSEILGSKRLVYWLFIFLGNDALVNATQLIGAIVLFVASFRFLNLVGCSSFVSLSGAFAIFNLPLILIQTQTNQEHVNLAAFTFTSLLLMMEIHKNKFFGIFMFSVSAILMLGTKTSSVLHLALMFPAFLFLNWNQIIGLIRKNLVLTLIATVIIPSLVYIILDKLHVTSLILGNIGFSRSGGSILDGLLNLVSKYYSLFSLNIVEIPEKILDRKFSFYNADSDSISSFGPQFILFGILGLLTGISTFFIKKTESNRFVFSIVSYALLLQFVYFLFYNSPWNYRLFITFSVMNILAGVYFYNQLKISPLYIYSSILICSGFVFISASISDYSSPTRMRSYVLNLEQSERSTLGFYRNLNQESWVFLNEYLEKSEPIAYIAFRDAWIYPYFNTDWKRKIHFVSEDKFSVKEKKIKLNNKEIDFLRNNKIRFLHMREDNIGDLTFVMDDENFVKVADGIYLLQ